ncbi:hypothetical protein GR160_02980 [Flavobacterium sp. Sd200]|uniref:hypothetical protein n=1 Tax=Flavobacterium sp. Sd200 TaxID=2692211 RepID=UPI0013684375|nr:hypothetical protein [Flavobacterium sp. Sd200]MXN90178.1 hypothetical protein [Flavobacterium sp. Sd200]
MRTNQVNNIAGALTAAKLFGYQPSVQLPEPETNSKEQSNVLTAVYPAIAGEAFARTMDNYRIYAAQYNFRTKAENELIDKHNAGVQIYKENNQLAEYEKQIIANFRKRFAHLSTRDYNAEVDKAGETFSRLLDKKRIQTLKYGTEMHFANWLHLYDAQLRRRNNEYRNLKVRTATPVQPLVTNSFHITNLKRNGELSIDVCTKTVRNHRYRLEEAGVFLDSTFIGRFLGVKVEINPDILVILDLATNKVASAENQPLNPDREKKLPKHYEATGTFSEDYKKKEVAAQTSVDKVSPSSTSFEISRSILAGTPRSKQTPDSPGGAAAKKDEKFEETLSHKLRALIIHPQQLALELAAGLHDSYQPIDVRLLYKEAMGGYLTRAEFRELVIQDFFKNAAKLYRGQTVYAGAWKKAINYWMEHKFITFNGYHFQKANIIDDVSQLRWRLEHARKWFVRTGISTLYPSNYFDFTRKAAKEIGFEYTEKAWKRHVKYQEEKPEAKRRLEKNAKLRLETIDYSKKFDAAVRRFLTNKITVNQLLDYVENNLPTQFKNKLATTIEKMITETKF